MDTNNEPKIIADNVVVSLDYTLTVDGEVVDTSEGDEPIEFIQGMGHIIPGLEKALYGMAPGDAKKVTVAAKDGYGDFDKEAVMDVARSEFPPDIPLKPGIELQMKDQDGETVHAQIVRVDKETVKLDFNHPLAGKVLNFDVKVVELRSATTEELEHGHVHGDEHEEMFDDDVFEEDLEDDEEWEDDDELEDDELEDDDELMFDDDDEDDDDWDEDED